MHNPLHIEQQYQILRTALAQPAASWQRAMRIINFLDSLGSSAPRYESYVLDALDQLYPILLNADPASLSPEELQHPLRVLGLVSTVLPDAAKDERYDASRRFLRTSLARSWLYVGNVGALISLFGTGSADPDSATLDQIPREAFRDRRSLLQYVASRIPEGDPLAAACLKALLQESAETTADDAEVFRIPVIERGFGDIPVDPRGMLRKVTLRITGEGGPGGDRLETEIPVYGAETIGLSLVEAPLAAARRHLNATVPRLRRRTFTGVVALDQHPALHEGDSAGLGIAALFTAAVLRYAHQRTTYRIRQDVAITGVIDDRGSVRPVNPASLIPKTRAVFFSRMETLVVPRDQLEPVVEEVERLRGRYPGRQLAVIGISQLREIFFDLRIIRQQIAPRSLHLLRGAWKRRVGRAPATEAR